MSQQPVLGHQKKLSEDQVREFHHQEFVKDQVEDFMLLTRELNAWGTVVDEGGGCGFFAAALRDRAEIPVRVIDMDEASIETCRELGVDGRIDDALAPSIHGDEAVVCFNLILHHLIGEDDRRTRVLKSPALAGWYGKCEAVFVNEYIYESWLVPRLSAWTIWRVTSSRILSAIANLVSRAIPSRRANTLGVDVRFRTAADWRTLFAACGYRSVVSCRAKDQPVSLARRMLLIRSSRRDSFLLKPIAAPEAA